MAKEKVEGAESTISKTSDILPETQLKFNEDGSVTIPEVRLSNPSEALKYIRFLENSTISKLRESNEYVINEIKEILEKAYNGAICDVAYEGKFEYKYLVEEPLKFLQEYEGSLSKFIFKVAKKIKEGIIREVSGSGNSKLILNVYGFSTLDELKKIDIDSFIKRIKKYVDNIPNLNPSTCRNHIYEHAGAGNMYLHCIRDVCEEYGLAK